MNTFKKLLISLVILILLSLFFLIVSYNEKIDNADITRKQLDVLEFLDLFTATNTDERLAKLQADHNNKAWLHLAQYHAEISSNTAYQLGIYFLNNQDLNSAILWFQSAVRQQHIEARLALSIVYFDLQKYSEIQPLLLSIISNEKALALLYRLALYQGNLSFIDTYKSKLRQSENTALYKELEQYSVFNHNKDALQNNNVISINLKSTSALTSNCSVDVQLFATNLAGLRHGRALISSFEQHKLSKYICLQAPKYIPTQAVNCQHSVVEKISCNASVWLTRKDITTRYIGLIVEQGKANVDNGIMYIDQNDTFDVLVHELSHFIGFVDEYPLPKQHQKCQQVQGEAFSHNLVVLSESYQGNKKSLRESILSQIPWRSLIKDTTPILSKSEQGWQLATPKAHQDDIGLFIADTCLNGSNVQAFKPISGRTKLEYFELALPEIYVNLFLLAPRHYLMPSYHYNISQNLVEKGEFSDAIKVLQVTLFD
tara:strand:+ start:17285 stop:18742 length:1458 start_codon:yes stop_codon:yes gene_type:complete